MTTRKDILILDSAGTTDLAQIDWGAAILGEAPEALIVRVFNAETSATAPGVVLHVGRCDMLINGPVGEDPDTANENGNELAAESWVEARVVGSTTWTPINEFSSGLSLGDIAAQAHVAVEIRINIPAGAESFGEVAFNLIVRCR